MKQFKEILINLNYKVYLLPLILLIIDQIIKKIVLIFLFKDMKQLTISSFLNLTPVWNKGVSFGKLYKKGTFDFPKLTVLQFLVTFLCEFFSKNVTMSFQICLLITFWQKKFKWIAQFSEK